MRTNRKQNDASAQGSPRKGRAGQRPERGKPAQTVVLNAAFENNDMRMKAEVEIGSSLLYLGCAADTSFLLSAISGQRE